MKDTLKSFGEAVEREKTSEKHRKEMRKHLVEDRRKDRVIQREYDKELFALIDNYEIGNWHCYNEYPKGFPIDIAVDIEVGYNIEDMFSEDNHARIFLYIEVDDNGDLITGIHDYNGQHSREVKLIDTSRLDMLMAEADRERSKASSQIGLPKMLGIDD